MKKRKTRKQKIKLGLKREIAYIRREIDNTEGLLEKIATEVENEHKINVDKDKNYITCVDYSQAEYRITRKLYFNIRLIELEEKLKQLNKNKIRLKGM